jgi:hypothetical protein
VQKDVVWWLSLYLYRFFLLLLVSLICGDTECVQCTVMIMVALLCTELMPALRRRIKGGKEEDLSSNTTKKKLKGKVL